MKPRKVVFAKLQTAYFTAGTGNMGDTLGDPNKHKGMQLTYTDAGLTVKYKGVEFLTPPGNIVGVTFATEDSA